MPQVQQTLTITIDDQVYEVASMSADVQNAIMYMDEWRQKEADYTSKLLMVRAAISDVQANLLKTIQGQQEQAAAATANAVTEVVEPTTKPKRASKKG